MARHRLRRLNRLAGCAAASAVALAVLPAAPALADSGSPTPHLDAVEKTLRQVSPGLEGSVWERTAGNKLDASAGDPADWLLQTPGCWGDDKCADRPGTKKLLAKMTENISKAQRTVDISTLAPFPNGAFQDAIVAGLKSSAESGNKLKVRVLVGAAPVYHATVLPSKYRDELVSKLGKAAGNVTLNVASMTTSKTAFSWNHSKLLVVDGQSAITGGINSWKDDYLDTTHPVSDVDVALTGPAAGSAGKYLDTLWSWTCENKSNIASVWFASSNGAGCMPAMEKEANAGAAKPTGDVPVIAVGGLGVGIKDSDPSSSFRPTLPTASDTKCVVGLPDRTNADRDYDTVNPEESALRALVASASSHIEISQQDLNATCPPLPRYDVRLYDALAAKMAAGVKVRIVVSDPANRGTVGSGGYSQIKSLNEVSDLLRNRLALLTGDQGAAKTAMCSNLQLATFRSSASPKWADGHPYAQHHKLVSVDGSAFYVGSKNLYPSWLQDFGYMVESPDAAKQLDAKLLAPQWQYSQATATFDYARGVCQG
ncbi:phospholipase [Streptomyces eurocidicus]|uniref:Phosphatidylserine/phosphatidylglycerophosphate/ cardiolipin synthase-like enzyme n=1 Tax=Streptomyces eurocidicus TaxID=66423 RepID=A0A2N8NQ61_STREU|nr:phospholipase D-like domain-containing protein [Streptomyces eurocidicus]MBB5121902.1 phosphatidylserine/phosphatidylglycerophosphate/cardiolipin synthase-like enzyme [Streptomyces eurocidicus]MBF6051585.1 phospholipase [Streptomyces eurocidicus]PNE30911.1 phospholipase [Streptomyces eurocidicus]